jgi:hypothetical protein
LAQPAASVNYPAVTIILQAVEELEVLEVEVLEPVV